MKRNVLFALVAAAGVLAAETSAAGQTAGAAPVPTKTDAAQGPPEATPPQAAPSQAEEPQAPGDGDAKVKSTPGGKALGMSILGNQEAPTSLVIVPWKGSELGGSPGIVLMLDDSRQPVDKDVFMRALRYHEIRAETTRHEGATAGGRANAEAGSGATQSTAARRR